MEVVGGACGCRGVLWKGRERDGRRGNLNHLSIKQCLCSAIRDSQQTTSPKGFPIFETSAAAVCGTTGYKEQRWGYSVDWVVWDSITQIFELEFFEV